MRQLPPLRSQNRQPSGRKNLHHQTSTSPGKTRYHRKLLNRTHLQYRSRRPPYHHSLRRFSPQPCLPVRLILPDIRTVPTRQMKRPLTSLHRPSPTTHPGHHPQHKKILRKSRQPLPQHPIRFIPSPKPSQRHRMKHLTPRIQHPLRSPQNLQTSLRLSRPQQTTPQNHPGNRIVRIQFKQAARSIPRLIPSMPLFAGLRQSGQSRQTPWVQHQSSLEIKYSHIHPPPRHLNVCHQQGRSFICPETPQTTLKRDRRLFVKPERILMPRQLLRKIKPLRIRRQTVLRMRQHLLNILLTVT
ncbi:MAG: hypothetical protein RLZZ179_1150 [Verrucomicrobiota bacterium]